MKKVELDCSTEAHLSYALNCARYYMKEKKDGKVCPGQATCLRNSMIVCDISPGSNLPAFGVYETKTKVVARELNIKPIAKEADPS